MVLRRACVVVGFGALAACAAVVGIDGLEIGACKGGSCVPDAGEDEVDTGPEPTNDTGSPDVIFIDAATPCEGGPQGPVLVRVGSPENSFCIDSTEVTYKQYNAFLEAGVASSTQGAECRWNASFVPLSQGSDEFPVTGVDWCDAVAFCKWSGKYLCGKAVNGRKISSVTQIDVADYNTHQWMIACSAQKKNRYPYGNDFNAGACNVLEHDAGRTLPVKTLAGCEGSYPGVYDLVGNVWEWFDGPCRTDAGLEVDGGDGGPQSNECWVKGGGFNRGNTANVTIDCRVDGLGSRRDTRVPFLGFRCCSD